MATQTDLDRLQVAWQRLQAATNKTIPTAASHLWYLRNKLKPRDPTNGA